MLETNWPHAGKITLHDLQYLPHSEINRTAKIKRKKIYWICIQVTLLIKKLSKNSKTYLMIWLLYFFVTIYSWQRQVSPLCIDILWIIKLRLQDQYRVIFYRANGFIFKLFGSVLLGITQLTKLMSFFSAVSTIII